MNEKITFKPAKHWPDTNPKAHWALYNDVIIGCYNSIEDAKRFAPDRLKWLRENANPEIKKLLNA